MVPPSPDQNQTIIDSTTVAPAMIDESAAFDSLESAVPSDAFTLSATWVDGGSIPADHTCSGDGVSPSLAWTNAPVESQSFALIVTDLDAIGPTGDPLVHWVVANIDPTVTFLDSGSATPGAIEGINDLGRPDVPIVGWSAPCPPVGESHMYSFTLHALTQRLDLVDATPAADLIGAIALASLTSATITGSVAGG